MSTAEEGHPMYRRSSHIAAPWPYYVRRDEIRVHATFDEAIRSLAPHERALDPASLVPTLAIRYPLGDRTVIEGIRRVPWLAREWNGTTWLRHDLPRHGMEEVPASEVAIRLHAELTRELEIYLEGARNVGILLSGGLDSRIAAGLLREFELAHPSRVRVTAFTWGVRPSRDIVLAERIADGYQWDWRHIPLTPATLRANFEEMATLGAPCAPFHLHGLPSLRDQARDLDVVLAGSYGDSIGRGEYSGVRCDRLPPILPRDLNRFGVLTDRFVHDTHAEVMADAKAYRDVLPGRDESHYREIERQAHYMRRMLHTCMLVLEPVTRVEQLFTHPDVVRCMWRLAPSSRSDDPYAALLSMLPGGLDRLPWARTAATLDGNASVELAHVPPNYHDYGNWLRRDLRSHVETLVRSEQIRELGVFDMAQLGTLLQLSKWPRTKSTNWIDEMLAWIATLAILIARYELKLPSIDGQVRQDPVRRARRNLSTMAYLTARELRRS